MARPIIIDTDPGVDDAVAILLALASPELEVEAITLVPIGPLTNIALTLIAEPRVARGIREIVLMGGAWSTGGNTTPAAEYNMLIDPHAGDVVLRSGVPIVMMPLDVTHLNLTT